MIEVDIIIITWNGLEYTKRCVKSIKENTKNVDYRIIFVDNNSSDGTIEYLKQIPNSILISNDENKGFAKAMNQGLEKVNAKYTVWLNNDTIVTFNWLSILINHLKNVPKAGAIGPVSNGTGIIQKVEGLESNEPKKIKEFGIEVNKKYKKSVIEYHRIAGFCIVMKSDLISKIGKLDDDFNHGGYDDDDYCKRIREKGYKVLIAEDVFVYHKSGASFSSVKDPDFDLRFLMPMGRRKLLRKWFPNTKMSILENPLVSIIMTTMNRKKIIQTSIKSVIQQSYKNWELLIVNDGGENIQEIVNSFGDSRIKYIHLEENHGKSYANNLAIDNSKGEIIAYLDDDDRWYENHLKISIDELLRVKDRKFVYTDYVKVDCIIDNQIQEQFTYKKELIENQTARVFFVKETNFIPNFTMVHKKELFNKVGKYDTKLDYYEDWDIIRRFSYVTPFIHIPEVTGEYWIDIANTGRNASALTDKKLSEKLEYIKNKNDTLKNKTLEKLDTADKMISKNNLTSALKIYREIEKTDEFFHPAIEGIADRLFTLRKYNESESYFKKMLAINPYRYSTFIRFAENQIFQKKYSEAKSLLECALLIADEKYCYYLLQKCYKNLGNTITVEFLKDKTEIVAENINLKDVEDFLINLYNKNSFYRKLFLFGYKVLKRLN
ncbi:MAG: glycosyltransferase family 2 protein [Nitrosopumilus sp.]|nr:glycosyltransferase family 2 protein [Nitrosopumilus sp.]